MVDFSKLELKPRGSRPAETQQFGEDHEIVVTLRNCESQKKRLSYRAFATLCYACDVLPGPKFTPKCFGVLNRLPGRLDALVCKSNGAQPNRDHLDHPANVLGWTVVDSGEELQQLVYDTIDPVRKQFHFLQRKIESAQEMAEFSATALGIEEPVSPFTKEDVIMQLHGFKEDPESMGAAEKVYGDWSHEQFDALIELIETL